ncbi:MAG: FIST C-terminal domain-containing protein [Lachnospiraceae bacterium]|nr:FIST C-terminal domain-containing protein [Lachnospiraceae bacterium]
MKQFQFEIRATEWVQAELKTVRAWLDENQSSAVVAYVFAGLIEKRRLEKVVSEIRQVLPEAIIAGASSAGEILHGEVVAQSILINIVVFETTQVTMHALQMKAGEEVAEGQRLAAVIDATEQCKAVEIFADSWRISTGKLFPELNKCNSRVKMFGAAPYAHDVKNRKFLFTGHDMEEVTLLLLLFTGKDFHVTTDYCIGWQPVGAPMTVTKADGATLYELDGRPAIEIYEKYLQIAPDDHFYENAFEFPFLLYTHDTYKLRIPFSSMPDGAISLVAPVQEGDTMFLSYGDVPTILAEIVEASRRMERFRPQYIRLYDCATRRTFWKKNINRELQPFQRVAETGGFFTGGELLRVNGQMTHFNSTLLIIGMREGTNGARESALARRIEDADDGGEMQASSMVRRMAHYINVVTQEVQDAKRQLHLQQ